MKLVTFWRGRMGSAVFNATKEPREITEKLALGQAVSRSGWEAFFREEIEQNPAGMGWTEEVRHGRRYGDETLACNTDTASSHWVRKSNCIKRNCCVCDRSSNSFWGRHDRNVSGPKCSVMRSGTIVASNVNILRGPFWPLWLAGLCTFS